MAYVAIMFGLSTVGNAASIKLGELAFISNRESTAGGPDAVINNSTTFKIVDVGYVVYMMVAWMQDGFLLYRFTVIFNWVRAVIIIPCLIYLLSVVSSILLLVQLCAGFSPSSNEAVNFSIMFWSTSMGLTLLLTLLIVGKLLHMRHEVIRAFGPKHVLRIPYLSISAMLVESALLYSLLAFVFLILLVRQNAFVECILPALGQVQIIAPQLIILRVAEGQSFTTTTFLSSPSLRAHAVAVPDVTSKIHDAGDGPSTIIYAQNSQSRGSRDHTNDQGLKTMTVFTSDDRGSDVVPI
ncbi:hypothetical protein PENSPDRAFT_634626 [Peniophora sp. CONT]|nr:hypothetical protein PENSPDRAFT_634626 [Peniophora sp. CONT]